MSKLIKLECPFCVKGRIAAFAHVANGECFKCNGQGYHMVPEDRVLASEQSAAHYNELLDSLEFVSSHDSWDGLDGIENANPVQTITHIYRCSEALSKLLDESGEKEFRIAAPKSDIESKLWKAAHAHDEMGFEQVNALRGLKSNRWYLETLAY